MFKDMSELNPEKIFSKLINKEIDRSIAFNYLKDIFENSNFQGLRVKSLKLLDKVDIKEQKFYEFLENVVISDENQLVRKESLIIFINKFLKNGMTVYEWLIDNESSVFLIKSMLKYLRITNNSHYLSLRDRLIERYTRIYNLVAREAIFFMDLEFLVSDSHNSLIIGHFNSYAAIDFEGKSMMTSRVETLKFLNVKRRTRILDLESLKLNIIPSSLGNLSRLKELYLGKNSLTLLPKSFERLKRLRYLDLSYNKFRDIPKNLISMRKLKVIRLEGNEIKSISTKIIYFVKQNTMKKYIKENIKKSNSKILGLLEVFTGCHPLHINDPEFPFDYDHYHGLEGWYYDFNDSGFVTSIIISSYFIGFFPKCIYKLKKLKTLWLENCNLKKNPKKIKKLKLLTNLNLEHN